MLLRKFFLIIFAIFFTVACDKFKDSDTGDSEGESSEATEVYNDDNGNNVSGMKRYNVETAIIKYRLSGIQEGTETLYFDNWGIREAKYSNFVINVYGQVIKTNKLTYTEGDMIYTVDYEDNSGSKIKNPLYEKILAASGNDIQEFGENMMKAIGGVKIGTEEVAGKMCDVWEVKSLNTKTWI